MFTKDSDRMGVKNILSRAPPCFERHINPLVGTNAAAFAVISSHQFAMDYGQFLCAFHKEGLSTSSGDINRLMMMKNMINFNVEIKPT
jgi:hypothetical protein